MVASRAGMSCVILLCGRPSETRMRSHAGVIALAVDGEWVRIETGMDSRLGLIGDAGGAVGEAVCGAVDGGSALRGIVCDSGCAVVTEAAMPRGDWEARPRRHEVSN